MELFDVCYCEARCCGIETLSNQGKLKNETIARLLFNTLRFVTPVLALLILLEGLKVF